VDKVCIQQLDKPHPGYVIQLGTALQVNRAKSRFLLLLSRRRRRRFKYQHVRIRRLIIWVLGLLRLLSGQADRQESHCGKEECTAKHDKYL
jgi:hypothetical protein